VEDRQENHHRRAHHGAGQEEQGLDSIVSGIGLQRGRIGEPKDPKCLFLLKWDNLCLDCFFGIDKGVLRDRGKGSE